MSIEKRIAKLIEYMNPFTCTRKLRNDIPCSNYVLRKAIERGHVQRCDSSGFRIAPGVYVQTTHFHMISEMVKFD